MPLHFRCPCGVVLDSNDGMAGKAGECPDCGKIVIVPQEAVTASVEELQAAASAPAPEPVPVAEEPAPLTPSEQAPEDWPFGAEAEEEPAVVEPEPVDDEPIELEPAAAAEPPVPDIAQFEPSPEEPDVLPDVPDVPPARHVTSSRARKASTVAQARPASGVAPSTPGSKRLQAAPGSRRLPAASGSSRTQALPRDSEKTPLPPTRTSAKASGRSKASAPEESPAGSRRMRSGKTKPERASMRGRRPEPKKSGGKGRLVMLLLLLMFLAAGGLAAAALFLPEEYLPEGLHEQIRELKRSIGLEAGIADEDSSARPTEEPVASPVPADSADEPADIFGDIDTPTSARDATIGIEFDEPGLPDVVIPDSGGAAAPAPPPAADIEM